MIVIEKGKMKLSVTKTAYDNFYKDVGWHISSTMVKSSVEQPVDKEVDEPTDEDWDDVIDDEPTKPLSEMNIDEMRSFAKSKGISLVGLSGAKQIREAIRNAM